MAFIFNKDKFTDLKPEDIGLFYKRLTVKIFMAVGFPVMVVFLVDHILSGNYTEGVILFFTSVTVLITFLSLKKKEGTFSEATLFTISYRLLGVFLAIFFMYTVGVEQDFSKLHWCYLFPLFVAFALGAEEGFIWVVLFFSAISFVVLASDFNFISVESALEHKIRFLISFLMVSVILLVLSHFRHRNLIALFERQQALKKSEERYKRAFEQNKALLREVHHRVKNNLQVISSLLFLQTGKISDLEAKNLIKETRNRLRSMAMVYETLYQSSDFARIDMENYAHNLFAYLLEEYSQNNAKIQMTVDAKGMVLGLDEAVPCCMILQELMSNAVKHAFPDGKEGEIKLFFKKSDRNKYKMHLSDNGIGFPKDIDFKKSQTLGLQLINNLVAQMAGSFKVIKDNGTLFSMDFPTYPEKHPQ
ncbi:MAG: histidine kinase dimerization/phosphoacceptor domain -containing protein [Desulfobacterales bacterium]